MALVAGQSSKIYQDEFDLTGYSNKVSINESTDLADVTTCGDTGRRWLPVIHDQTVSIEAWFEDSATGSLAALKKKRTATTSGVLAVMPAGIAYGAPAIFGEYFQETVGTEVAVAQVVKMSAAYKFHNDASVGSKSLQNGIVLYPKTTIATATTTNGTTQDNLADSHLGYMAAVHCFALTALDTVDVSIHESTNNFAGDDTVVCTFTSLTAVGAEIKRAATGTIKQYVRAVIVTADAGGGISTTVAVEFTRL